MSAEKWLTETLDDAGSHYRTEHHEPALTARRLAEVEHVCAHQTAKTVAVSIDGRTVLLVLPADRRVSIDAVREAAGARKVSLIEESELAAHFPDCDTGAIPPFRHWPGVELWADRSLDHEDEIVFWGGNHVDAVRMATAEWKIITHPREEAFSIAAD